MRSCGHGLCFAAAMLVVICATARQARAQAPCEEQWLPGEGVPGVFGSVYAMTWWDPDGNGSIGPRVVVGGSFVLAGDVIANNIAAWDPTTNEWFAFGEGFDNQVFSLATTDEGELVAGGRFAQTANHVARWDAATGEWVSMGSGVGYDVYAIALLPNGGVVAGGQYNADFPPVGQSVMRWNGTAWVSMGFDAFYANSVRAMLVLPNGDLLVGGYITFVSGAPSARSVARWNGSAWSAVGTGMGTGSILEFELLQDGTVLAVGNFDTADGVTVDNIASWNGTAWGAFGAELPSSSISAVQQLPNGEIIVSGGMESFNNVARWNGSEWLPLGSGLTRKSTINEFLILPSGEVLGGGTSNLVDAGGVPVRSMAKWNIETHEWSNLGAGMNRPVLAAVTLPNGDLVVGGTFRAAGDVVANYVARRERATGQWHPLGAGMDDSVRELFLLPDGDVIASGNFTIAGGMPAAGLARWNGETWAAMGTPPLGSVIRAVMPDGRLVLAGEGTLSLWDDGYSWQQIGTFTSEFGGSPRDVAVVHVMAGGDLIAGGNFGQVNGTPMLRVARWSHATGAWSPLGGGITESGLYTIASSSNGDIIVGGSFYRMGTLEVRYIARWDGTTWTALGAGFSYFVDSIFVQPDGDIIAAGRFTQSGSTPMRNIARWNGSEWMPMGSGVNAWVSTLSPGLGGECVALGSNISQAGEHVSAFVARWGVPERCCFADFDQNGAREVPDIFAFLSAWFAQELISDFDGDGTLAVPDIFAFLSAWFAGC